MKKVQQKSAKREPTTSAPPRDERNATLTEISELRSRYRGGSLEMVATYALDDLFLMIEHLEGFVLADDRSSQTIVRQLLEIHDSLRLATDALGRKAVA